MKYYLVIIFILVFVVTVPLLAQEMDCDIKLHLDNVTAGGRDNLTEFAAQLKQYINGNKWTSEDFGDYKIKCNMEIFILGVTNNHYTAQAFIGSQRPIGKTGRNTATVRILDDKWEFDYSRSESMNRDDNRFDNLLSFMDYYAYVLLGLDFDSFKAFDGTKYFNKAMDIVNRARASGSSGTGWQSSSSTTYSREQLLNDLFSPDQKEIRKAFFTYHYNGLDLLDVKDKRVKAQTNMLNAIGNIGKVKDNLTQQTVLMKLFFDTKYQEIADVFQDYSDKSVYETFAKIDPSHLKTYQDYAKK